jgi:hypothetical protein
MSKELKNGNWDIFVKYLRFNTRMFFKLVCKDFERAVFASGNATLDETI